MKKEMVITINDYEKITGLMEFNPSQNQSPEIAGRLWKALNGAKRIPQEHVSANVVTMNSRVRVRQLGSGRETELTITYPDEANIREKKLSVFSPAGVALLGCREGDIATWQIPNGVGRFRIEKVIYQPEAEGHYYR